MNRYEVNQRLLKEGKDVSDLDCIYTIDEIKKKVAELYPSLEEKDIEYHAHHILENDWLKVSNDEDELKNVIQEQVEQTF